jgi:hypothetical protein
LPPGIYPVSALNGLILIDMTSYILKALGIDGSFLHPIAKIKRNVYDTKDNKAVVKAFNSFVPVFNDFIVRRGAEAYLSAYSTSENQGEMIKHYVSLVEEL